MGSNYSFALQNSLYRKTNSYVAMRFSLPKIIPVSIGNSFVEVCNPGYWFILGVDRMAYIREGSQAEDVTWCDG